MAWDSFLPGGGKKKPPRNALAAGVSAGVDQLQGLGYSALGGVADMVGAEGVQNWANERAALQQEEAAKAGRPDLERLEDQTLGSALPFIGYQIAKQVPLMGAVMGAQLIPGVGQAASALGLSRLGAVAPRFLGGGGLQAGAGHAAARAALAQGQALGASTLVGSGLGFGSMYGESVEGGDPSPWKAAALAPIYGVSEAVVPAAVRGLLRAPANFSGNLLTRMGKTALMAGGGEAGTELVQNELEMGMRRDLTDEEMFSRRLNSAATGGLVGGALGSLGGIRRPRQESSPGIDPLQDQRQDPQRGQRGLPPNLVTEDDTFGQRVAQRWAGPDAPLEGKERKQREAEYEAMFAEPSGLRVADPKTGVERELTVGDTWEMYQRARQTMPAGTAPDYESWLAGTGPSEWNADPMTSAVQTGDAPATYVDLVGGNTPPGTLDANLSGGGTGPFAYSGRGALPPQGAQPGAYLPPFPEATQLPDTPSVMQANQFGQVGASDAQNATLAAGAPSDMGAELGRQKALEARAAQMKLEELKRAAAAKAEEIKANEARAAEFGIKGDKGVGLFVELAKMRDANLITDQQFTDNVGALAARKFGSTQKWIAAMTDPTNPLSPNFKKENNAPQREQVAGQAPAPAGEASTAPGQAAAPGATVVPQQAATAAAGGVNVGATAAAQPAVQGSGGRAGVAPVGGGNAGDAAGLDAGRGRTGAAPAPAAGSPEGVAVPAGRAAPGPVADKPASPGARMVRAVEKTSGNKMPQRVIDRLYLLMGMDKDGDIVGPMLTLSEVAAAEAARAGRKKPRTKATIASDLERHGVDVGAEALIKARQMFEREMGGTGETASEDQLGMVVDEEGRITGAARVREDGTPEMSDAAAFNAAAGGLESDEDAADGASTKDGANSGGDGGANVRVRQSLRLLADPKKSPQFNDAQRAAFADVLAWARADREAKLAAKIAANPEKADALREADAKKKPLTLLQAADALAGDKTLFPDENDRRMLKAVLGNTRGQNAAAGVEDAVRRVLEADKGPDPELVARNERLIAENARLNDERLTAQREDIAATVRDLLDPQFSDGDILDAKDAWEEYSGEPVSATRPDPDNPGRTIAVEITAPAWDAVPAELQAQWVKLTAARYTEGSVISAKDYARRFDAIADEAAKAGAADSRRDVVRSDPADEGRDQPGSGAGRQDAAGGVPGGSDQAGAAGGEAATEVAADAQSGAKFSKGGSLGSSTVAQVRAEIEEWLGINPRKLTIVQTAADLPADVRNAVHSKEGGGSRVRGVVLGDKAYLIAGSITPGTARSVFTHEVGVHLGMESILSAKQMELLFAKIVEWSMRDDGSLESRLATKARDRARAAGTPLEDYRAETIAYFTEEAVDAGIDPTAVKYKSELDRWFRTLWSAFKTALRRLRLANIDKLTAQDVVDLAYGAARLEMAGTWHGTAARFRKFSNDKIGTGEGAQAYGWGLYFAQSKGVGRGYWKADVERKTSPASRLYFGDELIPQVPTTVDELARYGAAMYANGLSVGPIARAVTLYGSDFGFGPKDVQRARLVAEKTYEPQLDKFSMRASGGPEGSLMRVDIGIADDEMLDWDLPMSEQSEKVRRAIGASGYDYLVGDGSITGGAFYEMLTDEMKYEHMGSNGKKEASLLLNQIGIKGIRFLDGNSRRRKFSEYPRRLQLRALVDKELGQSYKVAMLLQEAKAMSDAQLRRDVGVSQGLVDEVRELQAWLNSPNRSETATRNIVVFDDTNIHRVLTHPAADLSRAKFSVGSAVVDAAERTLGPQGGMMATDIAHLGRKLVNSLAYLHDLVEEHKGKLPSAERWYKAMNKVTAARNRLASGAEQIAAAADKLDAGVGRVNEFISRSTYEQKWGYDPKIPGKTVTVDPALAAEFRKLSAAEQKVVRDVFAHGDKMLAEKYRVLKALGIDDIFTGTGQIKGPYAPLKRFGDYVAVLKSAELRAAEQALDDARAAKLKESPDHYVVSYFDTLGQARQFAKANADKYALADAFEKSVRIGELQPMNVKVLQRVREAMKANGLPADARAKVDQIVTDMYFQSIDEHHARTSGVKRMNRAGYDADMIRSFLSHARAEAGFLSNLEFGGEVNGHFYEMQREAKNQKTGERDAQEAFNSFARHYAENLDYRETPWQDRAMALTSAWQLATSIGYHVTNATQGMMVTVPRLAADFNDYVGAWRNLMAGYGVVRDVGVRGNIDLGKVKDAGLRAALQEAADAGVLDVGMDEDLTHFERTRTGVNAIDAASSVARKALHLLRQVSRAVESANRIAAATAGYRMAMSKWGDAAKAQEYAVGILRSTQGDFSRTGAPLLLKKLPKVMTQYRKYQLMMGALYVKAFRQAFTSSDPATQAIGRRMLAYKLGHTAIAAGALGMPMVNIAGMVFAALAGGDDEPADLERWLREQIGDEDLANALLHGPLSLLGLDMSSKLGDDKIFSILPYTDINLTSADGLMKTAWGALGPSAAQAATFARGAEYMARGDFYKGLEGFMPKGVSSAMKAFRVANEGFTLKNGDVMFKPEDINGMALALDALGLPSAELKRMEWVRSQQYEIGRFYVDRTKQIQREYAKAAKDGDSDEMLELREEWQALQDGKDRVRQYFNDADDALKRQPLSTLLKYPKAAARREEKLQRQAQ